MLFTLLYVMHKEGNVNKQQILTHVQILYTRHCARGDNDRKGQMIARVHMNMDSRRAAIQN